MTPSLTDTLCTRCGLCCNGSLFADVELAPSDDSATLEVLGLAIEDDDERTGGELLLQPCAALRGTRCEIYPHRPKCCRTFECRLLKNVRLGKLSTRAALDRIEDALGQIRGIGERIAGLGSVPPDLSLKERCQEVLLNTEESTDVATIQARHELEGAMNRLEKQLRGTFLGH